MSMRSIFVPWWAGNTSIAQLDAALALARRVEGHLDVVYVQPDPNDLVTAFSGMPGVPPFAEQAERSSRAAVTDARAAFDAWRESNTVPAEMVDRQLRSTFARWSERVGLPEQIIVRKGRLCDLTVLRVPAPGGALDRPIDAALFETGRPVLVVPGHSAPSLLSHVVIAWNGSLQATRAIVGAMPLLYRAVRVTVLTTPDLVDHAFIGDTVAEDLDLPAALHWHGIQAERCHLHADESSSGAALLKATSDLGGSLLVMGAYTHSRVTAAFLGGVTGHVLRHLPPIPVLMAH